MNSAAVRDELIEIIRQIQIDSELECPVLTGDTKPVGTIPEFDSKIWPVATTMLAKKIGVDIGNEVNIFFDETTKKSRTIDQIVAFVYQLSEKQGEKNAKHERR